MKRISWKKFSGMLFVVALATGMRIADKLADQWYGVIMAFTVVAFFIAQAATDKDEIKISAGPAGISIEEKKNNQEENHG